LRQGYRGKRVETANSVLRKLQKRVKNEQRMQNLEAMRDVDDKA